MSIAAGFVMNSGLAIHEVVYVYDDDGPEMDCCNGGADTGG